MRTVRLCLAATLIAASFSVVACGGSSDGGDNGGDESGGGGGARSVTIGVADGPRSFDYLLTADGAAAVFGFNVFEPLTSIDADGNLQPVLATEWSRSENTWTFTLRPDVKFHGGESFTSKDVVASYERMLDPDLASQYAGFLLPDIKSIKATSPTEVQVTTKALDPTIPAQVSELPIYPAALAASDNDAAETTMNGTGPYRLAEYRAGRDARLERFEGYWGEQPALQEAVFRFMPDPTVRLAALRANEIDLAYDVPADQVAGMENVIAGPSTEVMTLRYKAKQPGDPFQDAALREAANLAIDRKTICEQLYSGQCTLTKGQIQIPQAFGFNPDLPEYEYDMARAQQLVRDAGGAEIRLAVPTGRWPNDRQLGEVIENSLTEAGFTVKASYMEIGKWAEQHLAISTDPAKAYDANLFGTSNDYVDSALQLTGSIACQGANTPHCDEALDRQIAEALSVAEPEARDAAIRPIWETVRDQSYWGPLFAINTVSVSNGKIEWEPRLAKRIFLGDLSVR